MSSKLLNVQMKRSSASTAIVGSNCGRTTCRKICVGVAPSTRAASSSVAGAASRRAMRKRKANGNERHISKTMTVSSAHGRWERNEIGSSQPSRLVPISFTMPNWGLSMTLHTKVAATTGAT
jgi:hypothetical protein